MNKRIWKQGAGSREQGAPALLDPAPPSPLAPRHSPLVWLRLATLGLLLASISGLTSAGYAQQPDPRAQAADFSLAANACKAAVDSGSVDIAIRTLGKIAAQDPNYGGLKQLQDECQTAYKRLVNEEDLLFAQAKSAYDQRAYDEARAKFQSLAGKNSSRAAEAKSYLSLMVGAGPGAAGPPGAISKKDYDDLETAKRQYLMSNYDKARPLLEPLLNKGGTVGPEAKKYLDLIDARNKNGEIVQRGDQLLRQRKYSEAYALFQSVQQQDPSYPGLGPRLTQAAAAITKAGGTVPPPPGAAPPPAAAAAPAAPVNADFERGRKLFDAADYQGARKAFQAAQSGRNAGADLQVWIQKTELKINDEKRAADIERRVSAGNAQLRRKDYRSANVQFRAALQQAPNDQRILDLVDKVSALMKAAGIEAPAEDKSALLATALQQAIRDFYAGKFDETTRLLSQYAGDKGKYSALAYFYLGAAKCTQFFLENGSDPKKEAEAREFFRKGRQADPRFAPSADWVSPKIIAMYEQAGR